MPRREKWLKDVEGFLVFLRGGKLSYESKLTCMGFQMDWVLHLSLSSRCFSTDCFWHFLTKTLQVLRHWHPRSRWRRRFCFKRWASRPSWKSWISRAVRRSQQQRGIKVRNAKWLNLKKAKLTWCLAERNGWRFSCFLRVLFDFICLCWKLSEFRFEYIDLWSYRMSQSWPRRV